MGCNTSKAVQGSLFKKNYYKGNKYIHQVIQRKKMNAKKI